uniref:ZF(ZZ)-4 zinc finger protein n=1 Tax=Phallusia mammillata TaxID=59560 RepID=A0A6F9DCB1_9ASCI|nr:ZF(ZZ)-4 zinc finger protein [Phallusia mammillata]
MSRSRLSLCLAHIVRITDIVCESSNFAKIKPAVDSCFEGVLGSSISEDQFLQWLEMEPQSIVWLPTMHRLNVAKTSVHNVQCATCKVRPIVGLRFQCLRCLDYNSCQVCFLTRKCVTRSHRLTHPRQEYCLPAGSKQKVNALARTVRNIVTKRYKHKALSSSFLPIQQKGDLVDEDLVVSNFDDVNNLADQEKEQLEKLVSKLKDENDKMTGTVNMLETSKNEVVKLDEERVLLQGELDTVNLHNRNLKAELDNLKCVVFADGFADDEAEDTMDESSSLTHSDLDDSRGKPKDKVDQDLSKSGYEDKYITEENQENPFLLLADTILLSMDEPECLTSNRNAVLSAAEKVKTQFCDVIDCALELQ